MTGTDRLDDLARIDSAHELESCGDGGYRAAWALRTF